MPSGGRVSRPESVLPSESDCVSGNPWVRRNWPPVGSDLCGQDGVDHNPQRIFNGIQLPVRRVGYVMATPVDALGSESVPSKVTHHITLFAYAYSSSSLHTGTAPLRRPTFAAGPQSRHWRSRQR